jgi:aryl-alcohol dehydrogenase-like predicted oxidoreductase
MSDLSRRGFLQSTAATGAAMLANGLPLNAEEGKAKLPQRTLGKTGVSVPILGLGTVALGAIPNEKDAHELVNHAIDLGVTYIDTAPTWAGYGKAQRYLKGILKERRKDVFIVTKCLEPNGDKALALLKKNMEELGVDQVDLAYSHSIGHAVYTVDKLTGDDGTMQALEKAKKDGLCRFVGMTGHNRPEKFVEVLNKRAIDVMMNAVNVVDRHTYAFEEVVWPTARKQNVGLVAMKVFGGSIVTRPCKMPPELRQESLRFALSLPGVAIAVIGMGTKSELEQNVEWAKTFKPLTADEAKELKAKTVELAKSWGTHLDKLDPNGGEKSRPLVNT